MIKITPVTACIASLLCLTGPAVLADEIVVTHRSGKVQVIRIDEADDPVDQVSFRRKGAVTAPEAKDTAGEKPQHVAPENKTAPEKPKYRLKWAPPVDTQ